MPTHNRSPYKHNRATRRRLAAIARSKPDDGRTVCKLKKKMKNRRLRKQKRLLQQKGKLRR